jgi:hypothetical protein
MNKSDLSKMMDERSPLTARPVVETVELYTKKPSENVVKNTRSGNIPKSINDTIPTGQIEEKKLRKELEKIDDDYRKLKDQIREAKRIKNASRQRYTTHLEPSLVKSLKRYAFENDVKDYEVARDALMEYLSKRGAL